jgi:hypothetical protein
MMTGAQSLYPRRMPDPARRRSAPAAWCAACALLVGALAAFAWQPTQAASGPAALGVVDFYAITPVEAVAGVIPERTAADELSDMLAGAHDSRYTVIPRDVIERAEAQLHWNEADVLHFGRLQTLAGLVHADRLAVGWIEALAVEQSGGQPPLDVSGPSAGGPMTGFASLVLQLFDAAQGRIVAEVRGTGYAIGGPRPRVIEQVLKNALDPLAKSLLSETPR